MEWIQNLTNPEWIMQCGGLYFVVFIVFAETGLFAGFFLPGDSLLFITGMIIANTPVTGASSVSELLYWIALISAAGIAGNYTGYWFGRRSGTILLQRKDGWLFKKKYLEQARLFYEQKGGAAIVLARFLPVVRTFAPIVAGIVRMDLRKFSRYNIIGSLAWAGGLVTIGYLLGENEWVKHNLEKIVLGIAVATAAPVLVKMIKGRKRKDILTSDGTVLSTDTEKIN